MSKHTELPWAVDRENVHAGSVCTCHGDADTYYEVWSPHWQKGINQKANAEFIVKACNNHYQLLEALDSIADTMAFLVNHAPLQNSYERCLREVETARQAIKDAS